MNIRHLRYFAALARDGNHARAAASCNVTQPTLSEAVRQLEQELAVPLVRRKGQRFQGLTAEGERVLTWALRILADEDALGQELVEMRVGLSGTLRLGVIPAAMPMTPQIVNPFLKTYPLVTLSLLSHTSIEIQRGLDDGVLEAGLTYLDNEPLRNVRTLPLYRERYLLLTPSGGPFDGLSRVSWREAARLPLCLLTPDMQNRRIVERLFSEGGVTAPRVAIETNSVLALVAHVRSGEWSSIIPHTFLDLLTTRAASSSGVVMIPLTEPDAFQTVGLVFTERDPLPPRARALLQSTQRGDLARTLAAELRSAG